MIRPDLSTIKPAKKVQLENDAVKCFIDCIGNENVQPKVTGIDDKIFYIDNALSESECKNLCSLIDSHKSLSFWSEGDHEKLEFKMFRNANTIEVLSSEFVDRIWQRISTLVSHLIISVSELDENNINHERELVGDWDVCGLNENMLFARYPSFGSFAPHTDGRAIVNFNLRSFYSVIVYLNTVPKGMGAGTRFYESRACEELKNVDVQGHTVWSADTSLVTHEVDPVAGRLLIFHQSLVHEGVPPLEGFQKYIIRSDVMLKRRVPVCDTETDRTAYSLFRQAEDLAESGSVDESVVLFKKALKMSPTMAAFMGLG